MADDKWVPWDGSAPMPVEGSVMVEVKCRNGWTFVGAERADYWHEDDPEMSNWSNTGSPVDIVAYRVVS